MGATTGLRPRTGDGLPRRGCWTGRPVSRLLRIFPASPPRLGPFRRTLPGSRRPLQAPGSKRNLERLGENLSSLPGEGGPDPDGWSPQPAVPLYDRGIVSGFVNLSQPTGPASDSARPDSTTISPPPERARPAAGASRRPESMHACELPPREPGSASSPVRDSTGSPRVRPARGRPRWPARANRRKPRIVPRPLPASRPRQPVRAAPREPRSPAHRDVASPAAAGQAPDRESRCVRASVRAPGPTPTAARARAPRRGCAVRSRMRTTPARSGSSPDLRRTRPPSGS